MVYHIAMVFTIIGALNWGLVGITNLMGDRFDLFEYVGFGLLQLPVVVNVIYIFVGFSALVVAVLAKKH